MPINRNLSQAPKCLVTGGAGFIGSHVVDELIQSGFPVTVLDDLSGGFADNVNPAAAMVTGSVLDASLVDSLFAENRFDYVFHIAAYAAEGLSHFIRRFNYANNVIGSVNLINAAVRYESKCFVFTSSIAVYGSANPPMTEETIPEPEDPYGVAKYAVELDLRAARKLFGLNYIVFRPHNVYGERQNLGDRYRNVVGIFMNQVMQKKPCRIFGDGMQTRAFTHVSDVAPAIVRAVERPRCYGEVINIGADRPYTVNEIARSVHRAMDVDTGIEYLERRSEVLHAFSDHSKARRLLEYEPSVSLEEGLRRMAAWAWVIGPRHSQEFTNIEIDRNFPESWRTACIAGKQSAS
jgi:UDP-glucose 4-epimerase